MIYIASPYTHSDPFVRAQRYRAARNFLAWCLERNRWAYSPIVHLHELVIVQKLPTDAGFWRDYNEDMMSICAGIIVLCVPGWKESKGVTYELELSEKLVINGGHDAPLFAIEGAVEPYRLVNSRPE